MKLFTIGFTKKTAQRFFETLRASGAKRVVDVRLNNVSQLAGFVPNHVKPSKSVVDAVKIDNDLSRDQKEDLTALYKGMVARSRARRRQQQS